MVDVVDIWTGRTANALRQALRMTHEGFAAKLGTSVRGIRSGAQSPTSCR
jgi:8-oxo-dGTP diphosphatase